MNEYQCLENIRSVKVVELLGRSWKKKLDYMELNEKKKEKTEEKSRKEGDF